ncbi:MAG TPA: cytochrome c oxidase subunit II [Candidatus Acidoferrales bacterium]|nr:cytochrome c oxidase subunit II [Candidatus Acidoferrales bacterium]
MQNWFPENVSTFGADIDEIFWFIFRITVVWFFITEGLILSFAIKYRRREGQRATYVKGNNRRQLAWILMLGLIVLLLDLWIDIRGAQVWGKIKGQMPSSDLQVQITAKQFNWEIVYPGPDGKLGTGDDLQLENELHVPVGKIVRIVLQSKDVIHSLFLPNLRLKQDAVPGREIHAWFEATKPGKYEMPCAELCGFGHSGMNGWLIVATPEDYEKWAKEHWSAEK